VLISSSKLELHQQSENLSLYFLNKQCARFYTRIIHFPSSY